MNNSVFDVVYKKSLGRNFMCLTPSHSLYNNTDDDNYINDNNNDDNGKCNNNSSHNYSIDFRTKMLLENNIDGLLPLHIQYTDDIPDFQYDITGYQSLSILADINTLNYSKVCFIISGIYHTLISCEKYMLKYDHILFSPEQIFFSSDFEKIGLCYFPLNPTDMQPSLQSLFEYLLKRIDHKDEKCVFLTYSLHSECVNFSLTPDTLLSYISKATESDALSYDANASFNQPDYEKSPDSVKETINTSILEANIKKPLIEKSLYKKIFVTLSLTIVWFISLIALYIFDILNLPLFIFCLLMLLITTAYNGFNIYKELEGPLRPLFNPDKPAMDFIAFDDTCRTTLLSSPDNDDFHRLIYTGTDGDYEILLTCYPFTIGKSEGCNHILSNPIISRLHAKLSCVPTTDNRMEYYIEDLNSTNGTLLNHTPLTPYEKYSLKTGDYISFGHLTYIFR